MSTAGYETFPRYQVDPDAIAVVGSSAGGTCAYYSLQVSPKPKALVLLYAMGGDYLVGAYYRIPPLFVHYVLPDSPIPDREDGPLFQRPRDS